MTGLFSRAQLAAMVALGLARQSAQTRCSARCCAILSGSDAEPNIHVSPVRNKHISLSTFQVSLTRPGPSLLSWKMRGFCHFLTDF